MRPASIAIPWSVLIGSTIVLSMPSAGATLAEMHNDDCALLQVRSNGDNPPWNYKSFHLGNWYKSYPLCAGQPNENYRNNEYQSPIDIPTFLDYPTTNDSLRFGGDGCTEAMLQKNGHTIEVNFKDANCTNLKAFWKGKVYTMEQLHFHTMSETALDGKQFIGEMHMVHTTEDGQSLVIGTFLDALVGVTKGTGNAALENLFQVMLSTVPPHGAKLVSVFSILPDPYKLLGEGQRFYSYLGSLTTPPCTPDLEWISLVDPIAIDITVIKEFHQFLITGNESGQQNSYGFDDRPAQPLNGRPIVIGALSHTRC